MGLQFARNLRCRQCGHSRPEELETEQARAAGTAAIASDEGARPGDWICPGCRDLQFARNLRCRQCGHSRPEELETALPGDWICPGCSDLQFADNLACRLCGHAKPA